MLSNYGLDRWNILVFYYICSMRTLLIILCSYLLVGCNYKQVGIVLQHADSLMYIKADSAFSLLRSIDPDHLWGREQRAYFALLYTKAQHKNVEIIESDSLINIAVKYYKDRDPAMYTLALMYKGAALTDMGLKLEALEWYKQAEQVCDTNDYLTLGLLNSRMGELYQEMYVVNDEDIVKFKKSLNYYRKIKDSTRMAFCMSRIGQLSILNNIDTAYFYIEQAYKNTKNQCSKTHNQILLAKALYIDKEYTKSKDLALSLIKSSQDLSILNEAYISTLKAYANLGNVDSAQYYFNAFNKKDSLDYYMCLTEIEKAKNNYKKAFDYSERANQIADSIYEKAQNLDLYRFEKRFDNTNLLAEKDRITLEHRIWIIVTLFSVVLLIAIIVIIWLKYKKDQRAYLDFIEVLRYQKDDSTLTKLMNKQNAEFKIAIEKRLNLIGELITLSYEFKNREKEFVSRFNELIAQDPLQSDALKDIISVVNNGYNGLIDHLKASYPKLNEYELLICALTCVGYTPQQLFIILNAKTAGTIYNQKHAINSKLGFKGDLRKNLLCMVESIKN